MALHRRTFLQVTGAAAGMAALGAPAIAQAKTKIRVGYLHTLAVDGQMWLSDHLGAFATHGLEPEFKQFQTGLELFQAMIGGSLDVLSTGAVISNFPARGQGKMFLANAVEFATAQLWVPFNITVRARVPGARKLVDASAYYPQAAIMSGWATTADYHAKSREVLTRLIKAWAEGNAYLTGKTDEALDVLQKKYYPQVPLADLKEQYAAETLQKTQYKDVALPDFKEAMKFSKYYTSAEWRTRYADGTVTKWLQQVTDFFVATGNIPNPVPASQYFDPSIYMDAIKG